MSRSFRDDMDEADRQDGSATPSLGLLCTAAIAAPAMLAIVGADPIDVAARLPVAGLSPVIHTTVVATVLIGCATLLHLRDRTARLGREVSRLIAAEAGALGSARRDALTGLPNRRALKERIDAALSDMWPGLSVAVLLIDLDGFKNVNDVHGHDIGDRVLCEVADRLRATLSFGTCAARLGGDEFAVLVPYSLQHRAAQEAAAVIAALTRDIRVGEIVVRVGASVGMARGPEDSKDTQSLLRAADIAMYRAKQAGRGRIQAFHPSMESEIRERAALTAELPAAIAAGQIRPYYQPIVDLLDGRIVELEVLARWHHPRHGCLTPDRFIDLVETVQQDTPLLLSLLGQVVQDAEEWPTYLCFSLNIFPRQLLDLELVDVVTRAIREAGFATTRLCFEVTEQALVSDPERARAVIDKVRLQGMQVALDDFGTGFSSLYHLRELPFDRLKIDRSFIQSMTADKRNVTHVAAIVTLCQSLDLAVVAEGIESGEAAGLLARMGCDYGQGYHYARPVPACQVRGLLEGAGEVAYSAEAAE